jgi:hypothetical protein
MQKIGFKGTSGLRGHAKAQEILPSGVKAQAQIDALQIGKAH